MIRLPGRKRTAAPPDHPTPNYKPDKYEVNQQRKGDRSKFFRIGAVREGNAEFLKKVGA